MALPFFDIYVLSDERRVDVIEYFLARYCDRQAIETNEDGYEIGIYKNKKYGIETAYPLVETLTEAIEYGISHPEHGFCFYISRHLKDVMDVMLKFTDDGKMIFGVSIEKGQDYDNYSYAKQLADEVQKITKGRKYIIAIEYPPASDEDGFDKDTALWKNFNHELSTRYLENNPGKAYTLGFVYGLEQEYLRASEKGISEDTRQHLEHLVHEAKELLHYNEWFVALEMLLVNLDEINYRLDAHWVAIAQKAVDLVATQRPEVHAQYAWLVKLKK